MTRHSATCPMTWLIPTLAMAALVSVTACTKVPELDATVPVHMRDTPYPTLIPLDGSLATARLPRDQAEQIEKSLAARRSRLQARARGLNRPVVGPAARARMQGGVSR